MNAPDSTSIPPDLKAMGNPPIAHAKSGCFMPPTPSLMLGRGEKLHLAHAMAVAPNRGVTVDDVIQTHAGHFG